MPAIPVRDEYVIAGDLTFHYVQWGEQGSPLVCVHGLTANAFCFQALADRLSQHYRVFAYDLRGRGDSDKPEEGYGISTHAADLAEIIDALELDRPFIVGHSLGAMIGVYFAANYPDKLNRLVLLDGGGELPWRTITDQPLWLTASIARLGIPVASYEEFINRLKAAPFLGPYWNEYLDIYFEHDVFRQPGGSLIPKGDPVGVHADQVSLEEDWHPHRLYPSIQVPTLLVRAGQSMLIPHDQLLPEEEAARMQRSIKHCRYVNYPDLNHYTIVFGVDASVARIVEEFLKDV